MTDCVTPGFGGAGNTHASRTGFYELNKIQEMARGQLPAQHLAATAADLQHEHQPELQRLLEPRRRNGQLLPLRRRPLLLNTGEIAGVFDHEWGHGLDDNDAVPTIASPSGEGIADVYAALRLNTSCIGRNFRAPPTAPASATPASTAPACATSTT